MSASDTSPRSFIHERYADHYTSISGNDRIAFAGISSGTAWGGVQMEIGSSNGWDGNMLMMDRHFVSVNRSGRVIDLQLRGEEDSEWNNLQWRPNSLWIHPEGRPFAVRHEALLRWDMAFVDGIFLDAVLGRHYELHGGVDVIDDTLEALMRILVARMGDNDEGTSLLVQHLVKAFVLALGVNHGRPAPELESKSGLTFHQLRAFLAWVETKLDTQLTVAEMAKEVRLSPAHFSREFKRSMGLTPWEYVQELRLERVKQLLKRGELICAAAAQCGFFDQAHLSKVFKQRFGISPSAFARGVPAVTRQSKP